MHYNAGAMSYQKPEVRLYIDEVGTPNYSADFSKIDQRYLSLTGIAANLGEVKTLISPGLDSFKTEFLGDSHHPDNPVVLHRSEIVRKKGTYRILEDGGVAEQWEKDFLKLLEDSPITCITVVHDKKSHVDRYGDAAFHPYHFSLAVIMERYVRFLRDNSSRGDIMAESRGKVEDRNLAAEYQRIYLRGTYYTPAIEFRTYLTSRELKLKPKTKNISCLQLADLVAHPIRHEILRTYGRCEDLSSDFAKEICKLLNEKDKHFQAADRGGTVRVHGFGKVFLS